MRIFEKFPEEMECLVCLTNTQAPCVLIGIPGTEDGRNIKAAPVHTSCVDNAMGIIIQQLTADRQLKKGDHDNGSSVCHTESV